MIGTRRKSESIVFYKFSKCPELGPDVISCILLLVHQNVVIASVLIAELWLGHLDPVSSHKKENLKKKKKTRAASVLINYFGV